MFGKRIYILTGLVCGVLSGNARNLIVDQECDNPESGELRIIEGSRQGTLTHLKNDVAKNHCWKIEISKYVAQSKKNINLIVRIGGSRNLSGFPCEPKTVYSFSLKIKGKAPRAFLGACEWNNEDKNSFRKVKTSLHAIKPQEKWTVYRGTFKTGPNAKRAALYVQFWGNEKNGLAEKPGDYLLIDRITIEKGLTPQMEIVELAPDTWSLSKWSGFLPLARLKQSEDGVLHVFDIKGKYGFGLQSSIRFPVKMGDVVKFTAIVKGKGELKFNLLYCNTDGTVLGSGGVPVSARTELADDWREVTLTAKVEKFKNPAADNIACMVTSHKDSELYLKNSRVEVENKYLGDCVFPRHWMVFAPVPAREQPPLDQIPSEIAGIKGKMVIMENNTILLSPFFPERKLRNTAWLYAEMDSETEGEYTIGAGADYFMAIYVNGKCILDKLKDGDNTARQPYISNIKSQALIRKGRNVIAVKFQSGISDRPAIAMGGPKDLRNLDSALRLVETYQKDNYETQGKRCGSPKLIRDYESHGINNLTGQAVYQKGSVIRFDRTYPMPPKIGGKLFAMGIRVYRFNGPGKLIYKIGNSMTMEMTRINDRSDYILTACQGERKLKSVQVPAAVFPCDIIFAVDANRFYINAMSLHDGKLRSIGGQSVFKEKIPFNAEILVDVPSVQVDEFFTGLVERELTMNTVPFKVSLSPSFDPVKAGWKLIFSDEFDGTEVDWKNKWTNSPWKWVVKPENRDLAYLKDGKLHVKTEYIPDPKAPGKIKFRGTNLYSQKRFRYGYFETRVRLPNNPKPGGNVGFWLWDEGRNMTVAGGYEIDIFEDYCRRGREVKNKNVIASNLHVKFGPAQRNYGYLIPLSGKPDDFFTIGCKWTPFEISTYLNGKLIRSFSRFSPYQSVTYDAINCGFGTSWLYLAFTFAGNVKNADEAGSEEFVADWVRVYEYPRQNDPQIHLKAKPAKSLVKIGEKLMFEIESFPSEKTNSPIRNVYLFDNGSLINFNNGANAKFDFAIDQAHYANTMWAGVGKNQPLNKKTPMDTYPHLFVCAVQDADGQVAFTEPFPVITNMGQSRPYQGKIAQAPGTINAAAYDEGGQGAASYKQINGSFYPDGKDGLLSRKSLNLREGGEWVNYTFNVVQSGIYTLELARQTYRREWPLRAMILMDGVYIGDLTAKKNEPKAMLKNIKLEKGLHRMTLISACNYGIWATSLKLDLKN